MLIFSFMFISFDYVPFRFCSFLYIPLFPVHSLVASSSCLSYIFFHAMPFVWPSFNSSIVLSYHSISFIHKMFGLQVEGALSHWLVPSFNASVMGEHLFHIHCFLWSLHVHFITVHVSISYSIVLFVFWSFHCNVDPICFTAFQSFHVISCRLTLFPNLWFQTFRHSWLFKHLACKSKHLPLPLDFFKAQ